MPITVETINGMTIAEMYEVLEKAEISVRKNLSAPKLKAICAENLNAINKKAEADLAASSAVTAEGEGGDNPPPETDVADKDNQPDQQDPPSENDKPKEGEEIDTSEAALQKLYKRRAALDTKRDNLTKEIQKVMAARKEAKTLSYGEMLKISREEEAARRKGSVLPSDIVKSMTKKLAVKRANAQVFADKIIKSQKDK